MAQNSIPNDPLRVSSDDKISPESLNLRAKPKPVTRLNRRLLIALSGTGLMLIFAATYYALQPPSFGQAENKELYNTSHREQPEQLAALPQTYKNYTTPILSAPLPGELGGALLAAEQRAGLEPFPLTTGSMPFQSDHLTDIERAERIRLAQRAQQGRESNVFFQISQHAQSINQTNNDGQVAQIPINQNPFAAITGLEGLIPQQQNDPNSQQHKNDFLQNPPDDDIYNPYQLQTPLSPYQVMAGTVLSASLITGLNSDLPGNVIAQITSNVYDSVTGNHLLIPQGIRLMGTYDSVVAYGQQRALVVWQRLIFPDGTSIIINNLSATDEAGYAGLADQVDFHTWQLLKGIALSTLFNLGSDLASNNESDLIQALQGSSEESTEQASQSIVERELDVQPTITIRPGFPLRIIVHKDLILKPFIQNKFLS